MRYLDVDYINDIYFLVMQLSYYIRYNKKKISEATLDEMISLAIDLLSSLELYKNDKYDY